MKFHLFSMYFHSSSFLQWIVFQGKVIVNWNMRRSKRWYVWISSEYNSLWSSRQKYIDQQHHRSDHQCRESQAEHHKIQHSWCQDHQKHTATVLRHTWIGSTRVWIWAEVVDPLETRTKMRKAWCLLPSPHCPPWTSVWMYLILCPPRSLVNW